MIQGHNTECTSFIILEIDNERVMIAKRITKQQHDVAVKLVVLPSQIPLVTKIQFWGLVLGHV